jgi:hypothetical protein
MAKLIKFPNKKQRLSKGTTYINNPIFKYLACFVLSMVIIETIFMTILYYFIK